MEGALRARRARIVVAAAWLGWAEGRNPGAFRDVSISVGSRWRGAVNPRASGARARAVRPGDHGARIPGRFSEAGAAGQRPSAGTGAATRPPRCLAALGMTSRRGSPRCLPTREAGKGVRLRSDPRILIERRAGSAAGGVLGSLRRVASLACGQAGRPLHLSRRTAAPARAIRAMRDRRFTSCVAEPYAG